MQTDDNHVGVNKYFTIYLLLFHFILIDSAQFIAMLSSSEQHRTVPYDETCVGVTSLCRWTAD